MSEPARWLSSETAFELPLVVALGVALASGTAWFVARRLRDAASRHLVLLTALAGCLALPVIATVCAAAELTLISIPRLGGDPAPPARSARSDSASACACTPPGPAFDARLPNSDLWATQATALYVPAEIPPATPVREAGPADGPAATFASLGGAAAAGLLAWAAGTIFMLVRLARNCVGVIRLRRSSRPVPSGPLRSLLREVAGQLGMRRPPALLLSGHVLSPLAVGLGRPAVLLPERLPGAIGDDGLRDVLVHEAAHLRRGDQRVALLQELAAALYWPILPVHALNRELRRTREELCDDAVLAGRDAIGYGETLLRVAELFVTPRPPGAAVGMTGGAGELERRIARLFDPTRAAPTVAGRASAWALASLFIAFTTLAAATRLAPPAEPRPTESFADRSPALDSAAPPDASPFNVGCCPS